MPVTAADLQLAQRLADAAGEAIRPLFRADYASEHKADRSPVTEAARAFGITAVRMGGQCGSGTEAGFGFNEIGDILWDTGTHLEIWQ